MIVFVLSFFMYMCVLLLFFFKGFNQIWYGSHSTANITYTYFNRPILPVITLFAYVILCFGQADNQKSFWMKSGYHASMQSCCATDDVMSHENVTSFIFPTQKSTFFPFLKQFFIYTRILRCVEQIITRTFCILI